MSVVESNTLWAQVLADHLPRPVVISPGSRNTPLVLALAAAPQAHVHCILDERAAGFFALGLARATGQAVLLLCTSGSAGAHYLPAVVEAYASGIPLVILTADRPPEQHHCGAPQTIDQRQLFGAHVRWFVDIGTPSDATSPRWLRTMMVQALDHAEGPRPGPVHINVPMREPLWALDSATAPQIAQAAGRILRGPPCLDQAALTELALQLAAEPRGIIVAGVRAPTPTDDALVDALAHLASRLGWPVLAEPTSQLRAERLGDALVTTYDALLRDADFAESHSPGLIVRLGQFPTSKVLGGWIGRYGGDRTILVDPHGAWRDPTHAAHMLVVAEPLKLVEDLLALVPQGRDKAWLRRWQVAEGQARGALNQACAAEFWEASVACTVLQSLPPGGALHVASSMPIRDLDSFAPASAIKFFCNRGANGIDGTLCCALGTATGWRQGPTALLLGDLAFLHDVGALQLARQQKVSLTAVVVNNGGGGIFDFLPIAAHPQNFTTFFRTPQQADLTALARAAGATAVCVQSTAQLQDALAASWQRPGLTVVEAHVSPTGNVARHQAAWQATLQARQGG